jgi:hypothetical protein
MSPCDDCAKGKLKKTNIPKEAQETSTILCERISFDISTVATASHAGNKFWLLIMDECTKYCWSIFLKQKSDLPDAMIKWMNNIKRILNLDVKFFRCDNSGENRKFQERIKNETKFNVTFEFTAPNTPQQNGRVERKFATLYGKVRSILNRAKVPLWLRNKLWAYAAQHATKLENILVDENT